MLLMCPIPEEVPILSLRTVFLCQNALSIQDGLSFHGLARFS
jgi:hypothetical protein